MTAGEVKFSDAISWIVVFWRSSSRRTMSASTGSVAASAASPQADRSLMAPSAPARDGCAERSSAPSARCSCPFGLLDLGDLLQAADVAPPLELGRDPECQDLLGQLRRDDAATHRQDVRVVVLARQARGEQVLTERRAHATNLVRGDLLALPAPAEHDSPIGFTRRDRARDRGAERRVVDRLLRRGAQVVHLMAPVLQDAGEVLLEPVSGMVGADGDSHAAAPPVRRLGRDLERLVWGLRASGGAPTGGV